MGCIHRADRLQRTSWGRGAIRGRVKLVMAGQAEIVMPREGPLSLLVRQIRQPISLG